MATDTPLQLGIVGLGRMGGNIARRLLRDGHRPVGYNRDPAPVAALVAEGGVPADPARFARQITKLMQEVTG